MKSVNTWLTINTNIHWYIVLEITGLSTAKCLKRWTRIAFYLKYCESILIFDRMMDIIFIQFSKRSASNPINDSKIQTSVALMEVWRTDPINFVSFAHPWIFVQRRIWIKNLKSLLKDVSVKSNCLVAVYFVSKKLKSSVFAISCSW